MPVGPVQDEAARALVDDLCMAGLGAAIEVEGSLGGRVRATRQRRDCVIAVMGRAKSRRATYR
jgi:threonyl-tRNA synthetase